MLGPVDVCVCVCVLVCIYVSVYREYASMFARACAKIDTLMGCPAALSLSLSLSLYKFVCIITNEREHVCVYAFMHVCMHAFINRSTWLERILRRYRRLSQSHCWGGTAHVVAFLFFGHCQGNTLLEAKLSYCSHREHVNPCEVECLKSCGTAVCIS